MAGVKGVKAGRVHLSSGSRYYSVIAYSTADTLRSSLVGSHVYLLYTVAEMFCYYVVKLPLVMI